MDDHLLEILKVNESSGGDPSLEVRLEPLWRRSTLVDLAKESWCWVELPGVSICK